MLFTAPRDGGLAKFHTLFRRTWYDYGGGEVIQLYLCIDAICEPMIFFLIAAYRANWRQRVLYHAVSQAQLNRAHNGMKLDVCLEHSRATVAPSLAIVFCLGMPVSVGIAWVGICFKQIAIRYILFFHARIPLWRDGASVHWNLSCLKLCAVCHFLVSWAMCAGRYLASRGRGRYRSSCWCLYYSDFRISRQQCITDICINCNSMYKAMLAADNQHCCSRY